MKQMYIIQTKKKGDCCIDDSVLEEMWLTDNPLPEEIILEWSRFK